MVVALQQVSKRFGTRWALKRVDLSVSAGQTVLLTGHNGSGKTTLLRILATALVPTSGDVHILGQHPHQDAHALRVVRSRIGLLTHQSYLYEALSARENLLFVQRLLCHHQAPLPHASRESVAEHLSIDQVLAQVGLTPHADRSVYGFSAGMRRRLCIARLLLQQPQLVLLDEPFAALDTAGMDLMQQTVLHFQQHGATIIMSTHDVQRSASLCTMHVHMAHGQIQ